CEGIINPLVIQSHYLHGSTGQTPLSIVTAPSKQHLFPRGIKYNGVARRDQSPLFTYPVAIEQHVWGCLLSKQRGADGGSIAALGRILQGGG
ncbi:uncharacterized protein METZ01_LOCUS500912, partial [marine metagenome]